MPHTKIVSRLRSAIGVLALTTAFFVPSSNLWAQADQTPAIVGSWVVTIPPGFDKPGSNGNRSMLSFSPGGGGLLATNPTNALGVLAWKQAADRQFAVTIVQVLYGQDGKSANGDLGTLKIRGLATLNDAGDSLVLTITFQALSLDGTVLDSFSATLNAARVQVEPL